jgi:3',5'-cyclic AMP phosphodiesterase CpdA
MFKMKMPFFQSRKEMHGTMNRLLIVCCVLILPCTLSTTAGTADFTFVQLCDPQLDVTDYKEDICSLEQAVKQINLLNPKFVLLCGDLVHKPNKTSLSDFRKIMEALTVPCHYIPGNHDVTLHETGDALDQYREVFGKDYYGFTEGRFQFVLFNTQLMKTPVPGESGKQMAWLVEELEGTRLAGTIPILVGHHPPFYRQPDEAETWQGLPVEPRRMLLNLGNQYRAPVYLSGHTHHFVAHRYADMDIISGECISTNVDGHALGFRLWRAGETQLPKSTFIPLYKRTQIKPKPAYDPATETGTTAQCLANLRLLDAAKEAFAMQRHLPNGAAVEEEELYKSIKGGRAAMVCLDGGTYRLLPLGSDPECSLATHRLPYFYQFEEFRKRAAMQRAED